MQHPSKMRWFTSRVSREKDASHEERHVTSLIVFSLTGDEETKDAHEQDETNDTNGADETGVQVEPVTAKIKPIPKYASFFIFSHTNG